MRNCFSLVVLLFVFPVSFAQAPAPPPAGDLPQLEHLSANQVNPDVNPCTDFYQYTCSKFFAANPIPPDRDGWGVVGPLAEWNEGILRQVLEAAATKKAGRSANEQKIGDFWSSCMDESKIERTSADKLNRELRRINDLKDKSQFADEVAHLHLTIPRAWKTGDAGTLAAVFGFGSYSDYDDATRVIAAFDQGGFSLPSREFYLTDSPKVVEIRKRYRTHIENMFKLAGEGETQAAEHAAIALEMETELARSAMDGVKRRNPKNRNNKMSLEQVQQLAPSFHWKQYLTLVHATNSSTYLVTSPDFFRGLEQLLQQQPLDHWKAYLRWQLLHYSASYLSRPFMQEDFSFTRTLTGATQLPPRWRECANSTDSFLGEALGQAYVRRAFPPENKERVLNMVKAIKSALNQDVAEIDWMTPETKRQANVKLQLILDRIGYPDHWLDYSALEITPDSYLDNVHRATAFEFNRQIQKIGKPLDRQEWQMTPRAINAYYGSQSNTINFPAGILQPPIFDANQDDAANFGAAGAVIGHEITHGFDDQGRKFDGQGNLHDWWTAEDVKRYEAHSKCISDEYTQEVPELKVKTNGALTLGEDIADNGGVHLALMALESTLKQQGRSLDSKGTDGLTEVQRFFLAFANARCLEGRPEVMLTVVLSDTHSLPKYRVNNVVANMPEFAKAFGCKKGELLVHENACHVW